MEPGTPRRILVMVVGLVLAATGLTLVFLSMRAVMDIGGACASGGPYVVATPCPEGVVALLPLGIIGGLVGVALYAVAGSRLPGPHLTYLAWSALFLSLGWNFWEFGMNPPFGTGPVWGWIISGVVFVVMGAFPLLGLLNADIRRRTFWADAGSAPRGVRPLPNALPGRARSSEAARSAAPTPRTRPPASSLSLELDRLAHLHAQGALTDDEFRAAKQKILGTP